MDYLLVLVSEEVFSKKLDTALSLCNTQINVSMNKFLSQKASSDSQFLSLMAKNLNHLKKEIYMKYIAYGKREKAIDDNISDEAIQLFIDAINNLGVTVSGEELASKQSEIIHLFLYGLLGKAKQW